MTFGVPEELKFRAINGYNRERSGGVQIVLKPGHFDYYSSKGTTHGAWNPYDIHVKNCKFDGVIKQPVKMTGKPRDVKFDNLIINGSLVLNKEDRPYQTYSEWLTHSEMQRVPQSYLLDFTD